MSAWSRAAIRRSHAIGFLIEAVNASSAVDGPIRCRPIEYGKPVWRGIILTFMAMGILNHPLDFDDRVIYIAIRDTPSPLSQQVRKNRSNRPPETAPARGALARLAVLSFDIPNTSRDYTKVRLTAATIFIVIYQLLLHAMYRCDC